MSIGYQAVGWNPQKRRYDTWTALASLAYLALFGGLHLLWNPNVTAETLAIRALGSLAFLLLHVILAIGPLARLDARFLPLLYNRRHLGVTMFVLGAAHGTLATVQFHALGNRGLLASLLGADRRLDDPTRFPFEILGALALAILFLMAATSHDFWLANLGPRAWKTLHMGVYLAYALLFGHVALGTLQAEGSRALFGLLAAGALALSTLHVAAGWREARGDREAAPGAGAWVDAGDPATIPDGRARVLTIAGERVAVFRDGSRVSAVSNVCRHQNGPLGEGRVIDGCITCPWHGYQYRPADGCSPPPFTEKVPTHDVRLARGRLEVRARANPPGTPVEPVELARGGNRG